MGGGHVTPQLCRRGWREGLDLQTARGLRTDKKKREAEEEAELQGWLVGTSSGSNICRIVGATLCCNRFISIARLVIANCKVMLFTSTHFSESAVRYAKHINQMYHCQLINI